MSDENNVIGGKRTESTTQQFGVEAKESTMTSKPQIVHNIGKLCLEGDNPEKNVKSWFGQFKSLCRGGELKDEADASGIYPKSDALIRLVGDETYITLQALLGEEIEKVSLDDIEAAIRKHVAPKSRLVDAERMIAISMRQAPDESMQDFRVRVRQQLDKGSWEELGKKLTNKQEMERMILLAGCNDSKLQSRLIGMIRTRLAQGKEQMVTAEEIVEFSLQAAADKDPFRQKKEEQVHAGETRRSVKFGTKKQNRRPGRRNLQCYRCGGSYPHEKDCPASNKKCMKCNGIGHFAKMCKQATDVHCIEERRSDEGWCLATESTNFGKAIRGSQVFEYVKFGAVEVPMQPDTGSDSSVLSRFVWERIGKPKLRRTVRQLVAYDGHRFKMLGEIELEYVYGGCKRRQNFLIVEGKKNYGLLGRDSMVPVTLNYAATEKNGGVLVDKGDYHTETTKFLPTVRGIVAEMKLKPGATPRFCPARPVPLAMEGEVDKELDRLEIMGVIEKLPPGGSDEASPVCWVRKPNGTLRMCADFKVHVNEKIMTESYPLPKTELIFAKLKKSKKYAKLDLSKAYWQIALSEEAMRLSVINTSRGLYRVKRLQMGMKNSAAIFQRVIEQALHGLDGVLVYQDDVAVYGETEAQRDKRVLAVRTRLRERGFTLNEEKCVTNVDELNFLGFRVNEKGVAIDERLTKKLLDMETPTCREEVATFVGLATYFGRHVENFAEISAPLEEAKKKSSKFVWTEECQRAFETLRRKLSEQPVLKPFDIEKESVVTTDASEVAISGILEQEGHPCLFVSRQLSSAERNYSNTEREALAVVWAVMRLRQFLLGLRFKLVTDHKALTKLFDPGTELPKVQSARLSRWAITLMGFDFEIGYKPGTEIPHADALSRLRFKQREMTPEDVVCYMETNVVDIFVDPVIPFDELQRATQAEKLAVDIMKRIKNENWAKLSKAERKFASDKEGLCVRDGVIYRFSRPYIPASLRREVVRRAHATHGGVRSTYENVNAASWWPGRYEYVVDYVSKCDTCNKIRSTNREANHRWPEAGPWERVHVDWCYVRNVGEILVLVDAGTNWIEAVPLPDRSTVGIVRTLTPIFARFGVPKVLMSDNAREFSSEVFVNWLRGHGCTKLFSPRYYPQANGQAERAVQSIKRALRSYTPSLNQTFVSYLTRVLANHRNSSTAGGKTPAERLLGRKLRIPMIESQKFQMGDNVYYRPHPNLPGQPAKFITDHGTRTSVIQTEDEAFVASKSQISPRRVEVPEVREPEISQRRGSTGQVDSGRRIGARDGGARSDSEAMQVPAEQPSLEQPETPIVPRRGKRERRAPTRLLSSMK